jgi:hypothetical protein
VEAAELDVALEELETRLERLRALYEQYFMGLEKIEPAIARKDVDRRIYVLRREKIRNTAKRFKLQTIIQRYNTFQQYWQRICREIENGTYKRHLLRAQKNGELLTIAARKRLGRQAATNTTAPSEPPSGDAERAPSAPPEAASSHPPPSPAPLAAPQPSPPVGEPAAPFTPAAALPRPPGSPPLPPRRPPLPSRPGELALGAPASASAEPSPSAASVAAGAAKPPPAPTRAPLASPATPAPPKAPAPANPPPTAASKPESLSLDMDFMGDWDPAARAQPPKPRVGGAAERGAPPRVQPLPRPPEVSARPASVPPATVAIPPRPTSNRPPTAPLVPRAPSGLRVPPSPRVPPAPNATAVARSVPQPAVQPTAAAKPPAPKPAAAEKPVASGGEVDDARLRDLHNKLQKAKEQTKEANVSYEGLAKSIRATEAKLREQHKNRKIEFDVVIKDGKAVVKPIVR